MKRAYRLPALVCVLFAVAGFVWLAPSGEGGTNRNSAYDLNSEAPSLVASEHPSPTAVLQIQPRLKSDELRRSIFAGELVPVEPLTAHAPIAPESEALPAVEIAPPELPYVFRAQYVDVDRNVLILESQGRLIFAEAGDLIDDAYRVEYVSMQSAGLRYLPMNHLHTLDLSDD